MESHRRAALWRTKIKNFGREWWRVFIVVFTLAVGIPSLYSYSTRVSVVPFSTLRSHEALGTVFNVTNGGIFDLHNVTQECDLVSLKDANNNAFGDNRFNPIGAHLSDLPCGSNQEPVLREGCCRLSRRRPYRDRNRLQFSTVAAQTYQTLSVSVRASRRWDLGLEGKIAAEAATDICPEKVLRVSGSQRVGCGEKEAPISATGAMHR
jgi:hypothetical protein